MHWQHSSRSSQLLHLPVKVNACQRLSDLGSLLLTQVCQPRLRVIALRRRQVSATRAR